MRMWRITGTILLALLGVLATAIATFILQHKRSLNRARRQLTLEAAALDSDGRSYRDLNNNGRLDIYEDPSRPSMSASRICSVR